MTADPSPNVYNLIAVVAVAFLTFVVGPVVVLLVGRWQKQQDPPEEKPQPGQYRDELVALVVRFETRAAALQEKQERTEQRLDEWMDYARTLSAHLIRVGETPAPPPKELT